jgi:hypothetical protein
VLPLWNECKQHGNLDTPCILVGTKVDQEAARKVSYKEGSSLARSLNQPYGVPYLEISSKNNTNVEESFQHLAAIMTKQEPFCHQYTFLPWSTKLHLECGETQKTVIKLFLLMINSRSRQEGALLGFSNDIALYILHFLPFSQHDIQWFEKDSTKYLTARKELLKLQRGDSFVEENEEEHVSKVNGCTVS